MDDDRAVLRLIAAALGLLGAGRSRLLASSREAMREAEDLQPDLVVLDWLMPAPDGLELARLLRAAPPPLSRTRIVLISSSCERWRIEAARDAGVDAFLAKPITPARFAGRLRMTLEAPRAFLEVPGYVGPDRRRQDRPFHGVERRGAAQRGAPALQAELERRLATLAAAFPAELARTLEQLRVLERELAGPAAGRALESVRRLLHDLSGRAGSFGHGEVGRLARRLDTALATTGDAARRRALLKRGAALMAEVAGLLPPDTPTPPPARHSEGRR